MTPAKKLEEPIACAGIAIGNSTFVEENCEQSISTYLSCNIRKKICQLLPGPSGKLERISIFVESSGASLAMESSAS